LVCCFSPTPTIKTFLCPLLAHQGTIGWNRVFFFSFFWEFCVGFPPQFPENPSPIVTPLQFSPRSFFFSFRTDDLKFLPLSVALCPDPLFSGLFFFHFSQPYPTPRTHFFLFWSPPAGGGELPPPLKRATPSLFPPVCTHPPLTRGDFPPRYSELSIGQTDGFGRFFWIRTASLPVITLSLTVFEVQRSHLLPRSFVVFFPPLQSFR